VGFSQYPLLAPEQPGFGIQWFTLTPEVHVGGVQVFWSYSTNSHLECKCVTGLAMVQVPQIVEAFLLYSLRVPVLISQSTSSYQNTHITYKVYTTSLFEFTQKTTSIIKTMIEKVNLQIQVQMNGQVLLQVNNFMNRGDTRLLLKPLE
jgi:hypothetical protein